MKLLVYSAKDYEIPYLGKANKDQHKVSYTKEALDTHTAIQAMGFEAISIFSGDDASLVVLEKLWDLGVRFIALRAAGYNNIHIKAAKRFGFKVANAPEYSPHAIAEHAVALLLGINRKIVKAVNRVRNHNFLQDGLMGTNIHGKTVGIVGTGRIGSIMVKIMHGFGCKLLAFDLAPDTDLVELCDVTYTDLEVLCKKSDIISLHVPLTYDTYSLINQKMFAFMKPEVLLVNTARGAVVETKALIKALEKRTIGGYASDVYEKEKGSFFKDHSKRGLSDAQLRTLLSFPNVLMTPHQAFMTIEALTNIAEITFYNIDCWEKGTASENELGYETIGSS